MAKPTIQDLEALLNSEEDTPIQILPNGEFRAVGAVSITETAGKKPLTFKENLGGEYGV
jgi:phage I-like protein